MSSRCARLWGIGLGLLALAVGLAVPLPAAADEPIATMDVRARRVRWIPYVDHERLVLTVSRPDGEVLREEFEGRRIPTFRDASLDGSYTYELVVVPRIDPSVRQAMNEARATGDMTQVDRLRASGAIPPRRAMSGHFRVENGRFVTPAAEE